MTGMPGLHVGNTMQYLANMQYLAEANIAKSMRNAYAPPDSLETWFERLERRVMQIERDDAEMPFLEWARWREQLDDWIEKEGCVMDMREDVRQAKVARFEERRRQARTDGRLAAERGEAAGANPYPLGTVLSQEWGRGWREAEAGPDGA